MNLIKLSAAVALATSALAANAAIFDFGSHDPVETSLGVGAGFVVPGLVPFTDFIGFSFGPELLPFNMSVSAQSVESPILPAPLKIDDGMWAIYTLGDNNEFEFGLGDDVGLPFVAFSNTGVTTFVMPALTSFAGYFAITGTAAGSLGGLYLLTSTVTPIPESGTMAMLLAGLGVLGFLGKRRRSV